MPSTFDASACSDWDGRISPRHFGMSLSLTEFSSVTEENYKQIAKFFLDKSLFKCSDGTTVPFETLETICKRAIGMKISRC